MVPLWVVTEYEFVDTAIVNCVEIKFICACMYVLWVYRPAT